MKSGRNGQACLAIETVRLGSLRISCLARRRASARAPACTTAAKPDPLLADLSNAEIESLAAHLASLR
jgi:hypothetical protein